MEIENQNTAFSELIRSIEEVYNATPNKNNEPTQTVRCYLLGMMDGAKMLRDKIQKQKDRQETEKSN